MQKNGYDAPLAETSRKMKGLPRLTAAAADWEKMLAKRQPNILAYSAVSLLLHVSRPRDGYRRRPTISEETQEGVTRIDFQALFFYICTPSFLLYDSYRLAVAAEFAQTQQNKQNMLIT